MMLRTLLFVPTAAALLAGHAPSSRRLVRRTPVQSSTPVMQDFPDLGLKPKFEELKQKIPDLGIKSKLEGLPEPVQPWVQAYSARPGLFAGDAVGLLVSTAFNPLAAFPYWLAFFAAAQPLGALEAAPGNAYSEEATDGYRELVHNLGPAWAAGTAGGLLLSAPFADPFGPFAIFEWIGRGIITFACLGGPRAIQVFQKTDKLPELSFNFDLDAALEANAKKMDGK